MILLVRNIKAFDVEYCRLYNVKKPSEMAAFLLFHGVHSFH